MSSHCTTKLRFNTIFQKQLWSKIRPISIKNESYSIVRVQHRTSMLLEKYLHTSLASALAASRRVCCALLISLPSTAPRHAHTGWLPTRKLMMILMHLKKTFFFAGKIKIINKHGAGITNVKISHDLGVHATMFPVSFPSSGNISAIYTCYASRLRWQFWLKMSSEKFLAASRCVCCALLISLPSTAPWHAHTGWLPTRKLMMVLKHLKKKIFFAGKINILNKHDAGITNVKKVVIL